LECDVDFAREFLALRMTVASPGSLDEAIGHGTVRYGTRRAIVTGDLERRPPIHRRRRTDAVVIRCERVRRGFTDGERFGSVPR